MHVERVTKKGALFVHNIIRSKIFFLLSVVLHFHDIAHFLISSSIVHVSLFMMYFCLIFGALSA